MSKMPQSWRIARAAMTAVFLVGMLALFSPGRSWAQTGPVAAYTFNEGAGTTVTDITGNGNTGTISGATWTTSGKFGNALTFNGTSSKVTIANSTSLRLTNGMTLEAWAYPTKAPTGWSSLIVKNVDAYYLMASTDVGNRIGAGGTWTSGIQTTVGPSTLAANVWTHLAATFDGATVRLFVNGVQVASQAQTALLAPTTGTLQIGADSFPNEYFAGRIDEVRIYNRALSAAEIVTDMNTAVGAVPGTTPPTAPTGLSAVAASNGLINLAWSPSTGNLGVTDSSYRVERCQGAGCTTFSQRATISISSTNFSDIGLTASTSYSYRVRAIDSAGNPSNYSNIATAITPSLDTTAPSAPDLIASVASASQINLAWSASTDNVAVTGYRVERCQGTGCVNFISVGTPAGRVFVDTGLIAGTNYSYRVRATDAEGNLSAYSNVVSATPSAPDTTAPSAPPGLIILTGNPGLIDVVWSASSDNVGVVGYRVERCQGTSCVNFSEVAALNAARTIFNDSGLLANTSYSYRVRAVDAAGNLSAYSPVGSAVPASPPNPPQIPVGLVAAYTFNEGAGTTVTDITGNGNTGTISGATWTTSGKFGNALTFNGTSSKVTIANSTSLRLTNGMTLEAWAYPTKAPTGWSSLIVKNVDAYYLMASTDVGNRIGAGGTWTSGIQTTVGPSTLAANVWTHLAATFDGATVRLFVNGVQVASQAQTALLAPTTGTLQIGADSFPNEYFAGRIDEVRIYNRALSAAEIVSDMNTAVGTVPDTAAPTAPLALNATVTSASQIDLAWSPSTDNVAVTGYRVERCQGLGCTTFAQIATPASTSFSDSGLATNTRYSYRVRATDAAGNLGSYSNLASIILFQPNPSPIPPLSQSVTYQIDYAHSGLVSFGAPLSFPLAPTWSVNLNGLISYPLIAGNRVYVTTSSTGSAGYGTSLYALDKQTGATLWGPVVINGNYNWSGHAYDHGKIFVVNLNGLLRSIDAETGQPGWSTQLPGQYSFSAPPTAANGIVYVGGAGVGGTLYAVAESNGNVLWTASVVNGNASSPTLSNDGVFVSYPCRVYKFEPLTGSSIWQYSTGCSSGGGATSAYANGLLYVRDSFVPQGLVFDGASGNQVGNFSSVPTTPIPAFSTETGYFVHLGTLRALDLATQNIRWTFSGDGAIATAPIVIDGVVVVGSSSGNVYALDAATGTQRWSGFAGGAISILPEGNVSQPTGGLGAGEGYLVVPAGSVLTGWHLSGP